MKKTLMLVVLLMVIALCSSCYSGWQEIEIPDVGSFKVPGDWIWTVEDGLVYFSDRPLDEEGCSIYLERVCYRRDAEKRYLYSERFGEVEIIDHQSSILLSNSTLYGTYLCESDNVQRSVRFVTFQSKDGGLALVAWDGLVDEDTLCKIAKSYLMEG